MRRFLSRHWLTIAALLLAASIAAGELIWVRVTRPPMAHVAIVSALVSGAFITVLAGFLLLVPKLQKVLRDVRYRRLTRDVDRQMKSMRR